MAFISTKIRETIFGHKKVSYGTFTNDTTGGEIHTGLRVIESLEIQHTGTEVIGNAPVINETLPLGEESATVVTANAKSGIWKATGL
jgi:hypothetical protein